MASAGYRPCRRAFLLPTGAPLLAAPPCIRQRRLPLTAGDRHGFPLRVRAPHRGVATAAVFRWALALAKDTGTLIYAARPGRKGCRSCAGVVSTIHVTRSVTSGE